MKKEVLSILFCAVLLLAVMFISDSCESDYDRGYNSGYSTGYSDGISEGDDSYQSGYDEAMGEFESYKEEHVPVSFLVDELLSEKRYDLIEDISATGLIANEYLFGKYVGDTKTKLLHKSYCQDLESIPLSRYVLFMDNRSFALENGYKEHSCKDSRE